MKSAIHFGVCLLLALVLATASLAGQTVLSGKISDAAGNTLPGATVVLLENKQGTTTNEEGIFSFANLDPGTYTIQVSYVGFHQVQQVVEITFGAQPLVINLELQPQPLLLETLTVLATRAGDKSPFTYTNIKREALQSRNLGQDVPYMLDATPSVVVTSDAGAGIGYTGIRIRGTDPTRINVTINGIPLNDSESQGVYWVDLPDFTASTEDIQIQRGVGTSTNGAGAFGATINLNTSKVNQKPFAELATTVGSFGTWKTSVQFGSGLLNGARVKNRGQSATNLSSPEGKPTANSHQTTGFTLDGRLSHIQSEGYIDRASADLNSFFLSAAYLGEKSSLRANVFSGKEITYQAWNGVPAQWVDDEKLRRSNVSGTEKSGEPHDNEVDDYTQTHYQLLFSREMNRNWNMNIAGHYTRGLGFFEQYKANQKPTRYLFPADPAGKRYDYIRRRWLDNDFYGGTWALNYTSNGKNLQATFGGAWNKYIGDHYGEIIWGENLGELKTGHRYYDGTGTKNDFNAFTKITNSITPFLHGFLDLQYRRVSYDITGTDNDLRDVTDVSDYHFFNPKAGLLFDLSKKTTAYGSFAVGNREPNRDDFTDAPDDARPSPERLYNTELGFRLRNQRSAWGLNLYHMFYKDQLVLTGNINDVGAVIRRNVPDSYRLGLELYGIMELAKGLTFEGNATLSQNRIKNFTEHIDNWDTWGQETIQHGTTDIAFSPNIIAFGRLNLNPSIPRFLGSSNNITLSLSGKYIGDQYMDNTSNQNAVLDAYFISDFQVRYVLKTSFAKEISLNLLVNNLFNASYSSNAWIYRYISPAYDGRPDDPYTRLEGADTYNLTGYYPQAGRNFLLGVRVRF